MAPFLKELWYRCFRVIDDIKEVYPLIYIVERFYLNEEFQSVRKAAMATYRTLSSLSVRLCDPIYTDPAQGQEAISIIMPFLLTEGLRSPVKEVLSLTIEQIQKICKGRWPFVLFPLVHAVNLYPQQWQDRFLSLTYRELCM